MDEVPLADYFEILQRQREAVRDLLRVRVRDLATLQRVAELGQSYQRQCTGSGITWTEFNFDRKEGFLEVS